MSYTYGFINKQVLNSGVAYTLILEDSDDDGEETVRIEKVFKIDPSLIDDEFLRQEARKEIKKLEDAMKIEEIVEVHPDDAGSD
jgi:hypothetical protein